MSTIVPTPPMPVPQQIVGGQTLTAVSSVAIIPNPPAAMEAMPTGTVLPATLVVAPVAGQAEANSEFGQFNLKTPLQLPADAKLALQVVNKDGQLQVRILSVDGMSLQAFLQATKGAGPAGAALPSPATVLSAGLAAKPAGPLPEFVEGGQFAATVIKGTSPSLGGAPPPVLLQTGGKVTLNVTAIHLPELGGEPVPQAQTASPAFANFRAQISGAPAPAAGGAMPAAPVQAPPLGPIASGGAGSFLTPPPPAGTGPGAPAALPPIQGPGLSPASASGPVPNPAQVPASAPGASPLGAPPPPPSPTHPVALSGTIAANSPAGQPLIQTDSGLLMVQAKNWVAPGTGISLELIDHQPPAAATGQGSGTASAPASYPALANGLAELDKAAPRLADQLMAALPQAGPKLAASMSVMATALRAGKLSDWLGDPAVKGMERALGRSNMKKLEEELSEAGGKTRNSKTGAWNVTALPFNTGAGIEKVRFYTRPPPEDPEERRQQQESGTRFLVNIDFSQMGSFQLDGMIQKKKRFDLIVRTHVSMPEDVRRDISGIFVECCEASGIKGMISFQATPNFVELPEDEPATGPGIVV